MFLQSEIEKTLTRRTFLTRSTTGLGALALGALLRQDLFGADAPTAHSLKPGGALKSLHFAPKARRVIYLFQSGAPSHLDLFDPKSKLTEMTGAELPPSVRMGQRITGMTAGQSALLCVGPAYPFKRYGKSGVELSELLPGIGGIVDDIAIVRSMFTEPINHDPAVTFFGTGNQQPGRPTMGSWLSYGLGNENDNLPAFVVLTSGGGGQPLQTRYWGNGFLPGNYQGVQFRGAGDPVLYLSNPKGVDQQIQRDSLDTIKRLNQKHLDVVGDPEIATRINSFEMAYRMQSSAPELVDISREPKHILDMYGAEPGKSSFANSCLLARRLVERGVRFVEIFHEAWDQHGNLTKDIKKNCEVTDKPCAALIKDLKQRGMLDDTLVVWGGEFGRTPMVQGGNDGRDHHPNCFTMWLAGGGVKRGITIGESDEFGFNATADKVHVHDLHATLLHLLGFDHTKLTFRSQGRDFRLTDVHGIVQKKLLA